MKRRMNIAGVLLGPALTIALAFTGCGVSSPSDVTRKFIAAVEKGDTAALEKYATPETASLFNVLMEMDKKMGGKGDMKEFVKGGGIVSTEEVINGDKAVVTVKFKDGSTDKCDLIKVDGKWKLIVKK